MCKPVAVVLLWFRSSGSLCAFRQESIINACWKTAVQDYLNYRDVSGSKGKVAVG